ncbi:MAG TPA: polysaccharide deacetylase family protein [bacterium]|nr:polysaccharide deacetylase family protein [bacterium]
MWQHPNQPSSDTSIALPGYAARARVHIAGALVVVSAAILTASPMAAAPAAPATASAPAHAYYQNAVVVLTYHDVSPMVPRGTDTVSPAEFAAEMDRLAGDGFHFVSVPRLERFVSDGTAVPPNAVCVVFDNGYEGIHRYALPVLERRQIPAAVFLIVSYVNHLANDLTWGEIRGMAQTGLVHFYTETYDLHRGVAIGAGASTAATVGRVLAADGRQESEAAYDARVFADLTRARATVERETGEGVDALVYPYGQYTPALIALAHQAGYRYMFTTLGWAILPGADSSRLPRLDIGVWNQTPASAEGAILTVAAQAKRSSYTPPVSYVRVWH